MICCLSCCMSFLIAATHGSSSFSAALRAFSDSSAALEFFETWKRFVCIVLKIRINSSTSSVFCEFPLTSICSRAPASRPPPPRHRSKEENEAQARSSQRSLLRTSPPSFFFLLALGGAPVVSPKGGTSFQTWP